MIRTLNTDISSNWAGTNIYTSHRVPSVNPDGTFDTGYNYRNYYTDYTIQQGQERTIIYDFNNTTTNFYLGLYNGTNNFIRLAESNIADQSTLTTGNHQVVLTIENDTVKAYFGTDEYTLGSLNGTYYPCIVNFNTSNTLTLNSIRVCDSVLSSTEIQNFLGGQ